MKIRNIAACAAVMSGLLLFTGCQQVKNVAERLFGEMPETSESSEVEIVDAQGAMTVDSSLEAPVFSVNPVVHTSCEQNGTPETLTVEAAVTGEGTVTYQWYRNNVNSNGGGTVLEGETGTEYSPSTAEVGKLYYYVVATNTVDNTVSMSTSSVAEVEVFPAGNWIQDEVGWWYQYPDGTYPVSCWRYIGGAWYAFDERGYMRTGWFQDNGAWYFLDGSGAMVKDTVIDGYQIGPDGVMLE